MTDIVVVYTLKRIQDSNMLLIGLILQRGVRHDSLDKENLGAHTTIY